MCGVPNVVAPNDVSGPLHLRARMQDRSFDTSSAKTVVSIGWTPISRATGAAIARRSLLVSWRVGGFTSDTAREVMRYAGKNLRIFLNAAFLYFILAVF